MFKKFCSIPNFFNKGNRRTVNAKKNIIASLLLKGGSILISLQMVPATIHYVNPTQYGIWLTLSSLVAWFTFFDIGMTHGFRNRFAEAKAKGDTIRARVLVSTTYTVLFLLALLLACIVALGNSLIDWSTLLKVDLSYREELRRVFLVVALCFAAGLVSSVFTTMLAADQRPAFASLIQVLGQAFSFLTIVLLPHVSQGSLFYLALVLSVTPVFITVLFSICLFRGRYREYAPSFHFIHFSCVKDILGLGSSFFVIMVSMLFIFNLMNIIVSRTLGPDAVTQYNLAYKYFNILMMAATIVLTPFWSAFTDAYTRQDYRWMRNVSARLERLALLSLPVAAIMLLCSGLFYRLWIGELVDIPWSVSVSVACYICVQVLANVYMYLINGTGKVRIQLIIYVSFALVAYPVMSFMCSRWGIPGLLAVPMLVYLFQAFLGRVQLGKLTSRRARGIWNK